MTSKTQTVRFTVQRISTPVVSGNTVIVYKLRLDEGVEDLKQGEEYLMEIYQFYLPGRHQIPRLALVEEGDRLSLELEGLQLDNGFIGFDRICSIEINGHNVR